MNRTALCSVIILIIAGCGFATIGKEFDPGRRDFLVEGKTTKSEVIQLFGEPSGKSTMGAAGEVWTYQQAKGRAFLFFAKGESSILAIRFDDRGIVTGSSISGSTMKTTKIASFTLLPIAARRHC